LNGQVCDDVNECDEGTDNCNADRECINTAGSFSCANLCTCNGGMAAVAGDGSCEVDGAEDCTACDGGYNLNGQVCDDVNECDEGTDNCNADAECINTAGSFSCKCGYQYFKFEVTALRNSDTVQLAELNIYDDSNVITGTTLISNPGGDSPGNEQPSNAFDGNIYTKWLNFNGLTGSLLFSFDAETEIDSYSFTTANDEPDRDPISWVLKGSSDGSTWTTLDTQTNYNTPIIRYTTTGMMAIAGCG